MAKLSAREQWAAQTGKPKEQYPGSSGSSGAPKAPSYGSFKFDSSKLVPQYQAEAASIYNPQIQQIQGLQNLTKAQSEDARVRTKDEFAQLLKREQENINRRGAFFSGGAIDQENRIGAQESGAIRDIGFQEQAANLQYQGTLSEIAQAQKDYVSSKVEGAYSSAYKQFQDKIANSMNQYQLELGQYNTDRAFAQSKLESDRNYALSAAASARAGANAAGTSPELKAVADAFSKTGGNWAQTAQMLADKGYDVSSGSVIDNELRRRNGLEPIVALSDAEKASEIDPAKTKAQLDIMDTAITNAQNYADASGRSGIRKKAEEWFVGATDYSNLVSETNTVRTNILTLAADPNIKKFFGPQMTNKDVELMTSAGTTLNPELQTPETLKKSLIQAKDMLARARASLPAYDVNTGGENNPQNVNDPLGIK